MPPEDYDWNTPDILRQVWYEISLNPHGCIADILIKWYTWLYSQVLLPEIEEFECCPPSETPISDQLEELPIADARYQMVIFMVRFFESLNSSEDVLEFAQNFKGDVDEAIDLYQNP